MKPRSSSLHLAQFPLCCKAALPQALSLVAAQGQDAQLDEAAFEPPLTSLQSPLDGRTLSPAPAGARDDTAMEVDVEDVVLLAEASGQAPPPAEAHFNLPLLRRRLKRQRKEREDPPALAGPSQAEGFQAASLRVGVPLHFTPLTLRPCQQAKCARCSGRELFRPCRQC